MNVRWMSYLLALNFQAIGVLFVAWYASRELNKYYPMAMDWAILTFLLGLLVIAYTFYAFFVALLRNKK